MQDAAKLDYAPSEKPRYRAIDAVRVPLLGLFGIAAGWGSLMAFYGALMCVARIVDFDIKRPSAETNLRRDIWVAIAVTAAAFCLAFLSLWSFAIALRLARRWSASFDQMLSAHKNNRVRPSRHMSRWKTKEK